jgi:phosphatidate cytidylyltransferase
MVKRILSALVLVPAVLALVLYAGPRLFAAALGAVGTLCLLEYFQLVRSIGLNTRPWFGCAAFWAILALLQEKRLPATAVFAGVVLAGFLAALWQSGPLRERALGLMATLFGVFYLALTLYTAAALRFDFGNRIGLNWLVLLLVVVWVGDIAALVTGKTLGRIPLCPTISPRKTVEGAAGGLLSGIVAAVLTAYIAFPELPTIHVVVVAILLGIFGQLGDLSESVLKRAAQVKDSSNLIPGHGGVLDRVDSLLFAFPVMYIYLLSIY